MISDTQAHIVAGFEIILALIFFANFAIIIDIFCRYLYPRRESRKFVCIFYALAIVTSLLCFTECIYFSIKPK